MHINNVILQYHTLGNPPLHTRYWSKELDNIHDPYINSWLNRVNEHDQESSLPSASSYFQHTPLTEYEAGKIALIWEDYLKQNMLPSPGLKMLVNMDYLIEGRKQPPYQEAFKNIYRVHSIAFSPEGYLILNNRTHLESTFSPFQVTFEYIEKCQELMPVFEAARAAGLGYIPNPKNVYVSQHPELLQNPEIVTLSTRLNNAIASLADDNMIKISNKITNQQIAFFAAGNYIFAISGSLVSPSIFK